MKADSKGFLYPDIDNELCVHCGLCEAVCDFTHFEPTTLYPDAYVLKRSNENKVASTVRCRHEYCEKNKGKHCEFDYLRFDLSWLTVYKGMEIFENLPQQ